MMYNYVFSFQEIVHFLKMLMHRTLSNVKENTHFFIFTHIIVGFSISAANRLVLITAFLFSIATWTFVKEAELRSIGEAGCLGCCYCYVQYCYCYFYFQFCYCAYQSLNTDFFIFTHIGVGLPVRTADRLVFLCAHSWTAWTLVKIGKPGHWF